MTIQFLVRVNKKKAPRINIARVIHDSDGKRHLEPLGTLPEDLNDAYDAFATQLDELERFQLENYVKNALFNIHHFNSLPDDTERELLYFAPAYHKAIMTLWQKAKAHRLDFNPHEVMLTALLNKTKAVERALKEKEGGIISPLEQLGIDLHRFDKQEQVKRTMTGAQAIFAALIKTERPLTELADKFNALANQHQKHAKLQPHYLTHYANEPKRLPLWYVAIAIKLYQSLGKAPLQVLTLAESVNAWLSLHKYASDEKAIDAFMADLKTGQDSRMQIEELIKKRRTLLKTKATNES